MGRRMMSGFPGGFVAFLLGPVGGFGERPPSRGEMGLPTWKGDEREDDDEDGGRGWGAAGVTGFFTFTFRPMYGPEGFSIWVLMME